MLAPPAAGALTLTCVKCTRFAVFDGKRIEDASAAAKKAGWVLRAGKMICPKCPK